jgi:hypothetical protein
MRVLFGTTLLLALWSAAVGCSRKPFDGPTVDAFNGRLTAAGRSVSFPQGEKVELKVFHEKGQSFGIPIQADGSFNIGWMPIGKYSAMLLRGNKKAKGPPTTLYSVPGGLTIEAGKTEYTVDLGRRWRI